MKTPSIKVGVITDQTGPLSFLGLANANVARMVIDDINAKGGHLVCTYFEENLLGLLLPEHVEGVYSCLDYYLTVSDPFSQKLLAQYDKLYPGSLTFD